jgi:hypothetical protein
LPSEVNNAVKERTRKDNANRYNTNEIFQWIKKLEELSSLFFETESD